MHFFEAGKNRHNFYVKEMQALGDAGGKIRVMDNTNKIVATIPAKDEEETIRGVIHRLSAILRKTGYFFEIIVIDDGSTDKTKEICKSERVACISHKRNLGLAQTFQTEMKECLKRNADIIVHIDADGQYSPEDIPLMLFEIEKGYDLVLGSRFLGKIEKMSFIKRLGNKLFSRVISSIIGFRITDGQTGFRAFTRGVAEKIEIRSNHTYTQEQIMRAAASGFNITEVPVVFRKRESGDSRLIRNPLGYAWKAGINILRTYRDFKPLNFFGMIGLTVMLPGIALALWFVYLNFTTGIAGHMFAMMLMVMFIITGLQIVLFGFMVDKK